MASADKNYNSPLYSETTKCEKLLDENNAKILKRSHAYKIYKSSSNVHILNFEHSLTDTESTIRKNLSGLLFELRKFKLVTTLVSDDAAKYITL